MNLFAVLILYNCRPEDSKTLSSLLVNYARYPEVFKNFKLIIYDNSLVEQKVPVPISFAYEYVHDRSNQGLAVAYNYAFRLAVKAAAGWLLILDQDSSLPEYFIKDLAVDLNAVEAEKTIVAVVPKLRYHKTLFSPSKDLFGGTLRPIDMKHKGICSFNVFATGSGGTIRVSFLQAIGGFNEFYWLDFLDRWLYITIFNKGGKVYVTDSIIDHELSVMNYDKFLNEQRYRNILKYETIFMRAYKSRLEQYVYYLRLVKRIIYLFITVKDKKYSLMTWRHLRIVLWTPRLDTGVK
ncbi:MAG: glycosyltransferase [bacterium]|nr:glycosyltransferase [bacterium]